jgi:hypothetical protein
MMRTITFVCLLALFSFSAAGARDGDGLGGEYADVLALTGTAKAEVLALAKILRARPAMAIDFSHLDSPQYCFNTGGDMLHIAADAKARIPLAYLHPAAPLVEVGFDPKKLPVEPESAADLKPDTWYYYPGGDRTEPFHGKPLGTPMLVRTVGTK